MEALLSAIPLALSFDDRLLLFVNGLHSPYFDTFFYLVSDRFVWVPFYLALAFSVAKFHSWKTLCWLLLSMAFVMLITDYSASAFLRPAVARLRPANLENPLSAYVHIVNGYRGGSYGFPSAHAGNTWGLTFLFAFVYRRWRIFLLMALWAAIICYSRMYLGVHYFTDLLGGLCLGLLGATLAYGAFRSYLNPLQHSSFRTLAVPLCVYGMSFAALALTACFLRFP